MFKYWTERSRRTRLPRTVYVLALSIFALGTSEFMIAGLLPEIAADTGVSIPRAGLLISAFAIAMAVGAPVLAVATLRLPRRSTLVGALALFIVGHVVGATTAAYTTLLAARVVTAVATGTFWAVAGVVTVSLVGPGLRARALAALLGGLTVANVVGVPVGTFIGQQLGWRATFWAVAAFAALAIVGVLSSMPRGREASAPQGVRAELVAFTGGRLWLALGTTALFQAGIMGSFSYLAPLITHATGLPEGMVPFVLAGFGVGSVVGVNLGGRLADARPWRTLYGALAGVVGSLALLALVPAVAPVAVFLLGVSAFTAATPLNARVFALAGAAPTLVSATNASAFNVGNTLGPWLGGVTISVGLGYLAPAALGVVLATGALSLGLLSRYLDHRRIPVAVVPEPEPDAAVGARHPEPEPARVACPTASSG